MTLPSKLRKRKRSGRSAGAVVPRCMMLRCNNKPTVLGKCNKHAVEEADDLCKTAIKARDGKCLSCGLRGIANLQWSHHVTRARYWVRWDPENAVAHCAGCHKRFTEHPALHHEWIIEHLGQDGWDALMDRAYGAINPYTGVREHPGPFRRRDLEAVLTRLREETP